MAQENPVAQVFQKNIFLTDIKPSEDELKIVEQNYPSLSKEEMFNMAISEKLSTLIWTPIMEEFSKDHDVEPTLEELQSFAKSINAERSQGNELSMNEIYRPFVKTWKVSKALYAEYGGTVIFQQANPLEPVGAYRKLLEKYEAQGDFKIYDKEINKLFWQYYTRKHPMEVPPTEIDYSKPWWLKNSRENN